MNAAVAANGSRLPQMPNHEHTKAAREVGKALLKIHEHESDGDKNTKKKANK